VLAALAGTETGVGLTPFHRFEPVIPRSNFEPGLELLCVARRDRVQDLAGAILCFRIECGAYGAFDYGVRMRDDRTVVLCPTIDRRNYEAAPRPVVCHYRILMLLTACAVTVNDGGKDFAA
jgi:hypothetical protein